MKYGNAVKVFMKVLQNLDRELPEGASEQEKRFRFALQQLPKDVLAQGRQCTAEVLWRGAVGSRRSKKKAAKAVDKKAAATLNEDGTFTGVTVRYCFSRPPRYGSLHEVWGH